MASITTLYIRFLVERHLQSSQYLSTERKKILSSHNSLLTEWWHINTSSVSLQVARQQDMQWIHDRSQAFITLSTHLLPSPPECSWLSKGTCINEVVYIKARVMAPLDGKTRRIQLNFFWLDRSIKVYSSHCDNIRVLQTSPTKKRNRITLIGNICKNKLIKGERRLLQTCTPATSDHFTEAAINISTSNTQKLASQMIRHIIHQTNQQQKITLIRRKEKT